MGVYILATSCAKPDAEFPSLRQLAAHIVALRAQVAKTRGYPPDIRAIPGQLFRDELPGADIVSLRWVDLAEPGERGEWFGYAMLAAPTPASIGPQLGAGPGRPFAADPCTRLLDAINAAQAALDAPPRRKAA